MDAREVCITITGAHKSIALAKCIEEGVNHMWTVSAIQMHPKGLVVCDEDATLELHVKVRELDGMQCVSEMLLAAVVDFHSLFFQTVKYFKSIEHVHHSLIGAENLSLQGGVKQLRIPAPNTARPATPLNGPYE